MDDAVAAQYEAYPYPARDARDEARRLVVGSPSFLAEIDHWVFGARRDPALPLPARVEAARRLVRTLPATHWLARNRLITDHLDGGDAGLVDLLLRGRDRPDTVPAFRSLLAAVGLVPTVLVEPVRYDPLTWLTDPRLRERAAALP